jgi:hypothetical protein
VFLKSKQSLIMKKIHLAFVLFLLITGNLHAQINKSGNFTTYVIGLLNAIPADKNVNTFGPPTSNQLTTWSDMIGDILAANYSAAHTKAISLNYNLVRYTDNSVSPNRIYYILEKSSTGKNWGVYVFDTASLRSQVTVQAPHPIADKHTEKEAFYVFRKLRARVLAVAGTHRCNDTAFSNCMGTTEVCSPSPGTSTSYRRSDVAHSDTTPFHRTTARLLTGISNIIIVQLHGYNKDTTDPDLILGNGTKTAPTGTDFLVNFRTHLFGIDSTLTFKTAHINTTWNKLNGTQNIQGNLLNGSSAPCTTLESSATGRFLHIEQSLPLRADSTGWNKVSRALELTFPVGTMLKKAAESVEETGSVEEALHIQLSPNPAREQVSMRLSQEVASCIVEVYNAEGVLLKRMEQAGAEAVINVSELAAGLYIMNVITGDKVLSERFEVRK